MCVAAMVTVLLGSRTERSGYVGTPAPGSRVSAPAGRRDDLLRRPADDDPVQIADPQEAPAARAAMPQVFVSARKTRPPAIPAAGPACRRSVAWRMRSF
ncbi:hypothetical protein AQJ91_26445 [Streptomyces dysideae]|uniref:Uncharacterized protein n=1 Tax=Streptomyces dysideae TaxID=909626 RepID=A0A101UWR6_9ACTN|nr:hypothetical protein AQJ91_26445 [Streptomyces dysideae]